MQIRYLNTDLDLVAASNLEPLAAALAARGVHPLHVTCGDDGLWYALLETGADHDDPDATISAMLAAIESLEAEAARLWSECRLRESNIGYDCGDQPWAFNNGLKSGTLRRAAETAASLRITLYPIRPTRGYKPGVFTFVETKLFTRLISEYLTDDEYLDLQSQLMERPEAGNVIRGSGGVRKLRWRESRRGTGGGYRVIYYPKVAAGVIWMLTIYPKSVADAIPAHVLKEIRSEVEDG